MRIQAGYTNGQLCAQTTAACIQAMPAHTTCAEFCQQVTQRVAMLYPTSLKAELATHPHLRSTASAIVYSHMRHEIWMIGDCQCLVDGRLYTNPKPSEQHIAAERVRFLQHGLESGCYTIQQLRQHDYGRDHIYPLLVEATRTQNIDYAVIDGFDIAMAHVRIIPGGSHMVLASDGYPHLFETLAQSEHHLAHLLQTDPLCLTLPATKGMMEGMNSFDDRTYIRFRS